MFVRQILIPDARKNNSENVRAVDLMLQEMPLEVKTAFSPYPPGNPPRKTPSGLVSQDHLTIDEANVLKYKRETIILFLVCYDEPKVFLVSAGKILDTIAACPNRIYSRSDRTEKDKRRKIGVSASLDCQDITSSFSAEALGAMKELKKGTY